MSRKFRSDELVAGVVATSVIEPTISLTQWSQVQVPASDWYGVCHSIASGQYILLKTVATGPNYIFNESTRTFTEIAELPFVFSYPDINKTNMITLSDGKVFLAALSGVAVKATVYNPVTNIWSTPATILPGIGNLNGLQSFDCTTKIVCIAHGTTFLSGGIAQISVYDIATATFGSEIDIPVATDTEIYRISWALNTTRTQLYVFPNLINGGPVTSPIQVFDVATETFSESITIPYTTTLSGVYVSKFISSTNIMFIDLLADHAVQLFNTGTGLVTPLTNQPSHLLNNTPGSLCCMEVGTNLWFWDTLIDYDNSHYFQIFNTSTQTWSIGPEVPVRPSYDVSLHGNQICYNTGTSTIFTGPGFSSLGPPTNNAVSTGIFSLYSIHRQTYAIGSKTWTLDTSAPTITGTCDASTYLNKSAFQIASNNGGTTTITNYYTYSGVAKPINTSEEVVNPKIFGINQRYGVGVYSEDSLAKIHFVTSGLSISRSSITVASGSDYSYLTCIQMPSYQFWFIAYHASSGTMRVVKFSDIVVYDSTATTTMVPRKYGHYFFNADRAAIIAIGGQDVATSTPLTTIESMNIATGVVTTLSAQLSVGRGRGASFTQLLDGMIVAIGGLAPTATQTVDIFDPTAVSVQTGAAPIEFNYHQAIALYDARTYIYILGGETGSGQVKQSHCYRFEPYSLYWLLMTNSMTTARSRFFAFYTPESMRIYAVGGDSGNTMEYLAPTVRTPLRTRRMDLLTDASVSLVKTIRSKPKIKPGHLSAKTYSRTRL